MSPLSFAVRSVLSVSLAVTLQSVPAAAKPSLRGDTSHISNFCTTDMHCPAGYYCYRFNTFAALCRNDGCPMNWACSGTRGKLPPLPLWTYSGAYETPSTLVPETDAPEVDTADAAPVEAPTDGAPMEGEAPVDDSQQQQGGSDYPETDCTDMFEGCSSCWRTQALADSCMDSYMCSPDEPYMGCDFCWTSRVDALTCSCPADMPYSYCGTCFASTTDSSSCQGPFPGNN